MENTTNTETTGTKYYPNGRDAAPVILRVEKVARGLETQRRYAAGYANRRPTADEIEIGGWTQQDVWEMHTVQLREVARMEKALACVEAGTPELPAELYPEYCR